MTRGRAAAVAEAPVRVRIDHIGSGGDGVARLDDGRLAYVPGTLPGETVRAEPMQARGQGLALRLLEIEAPSPDRVVPPCPLFGPCGGCMLQHWGMAPYADWKRARVTEALAQAGFSLPEIAPLVPAAPFQRRRMDFAVARGPEGVRIGLHARHGGEIVDMVACDVLAPRLFALLAPLRVALRGLAGLCRGGSLLGNLLTTGPDLLLRLDGEVSARDRTVLGDFARLHEVPRISVARGAAPPEAAAQLAPAVQRIAGQDVAVPPGGFLQATAAGEAAIVSAMLAGLPDTLPPRARILELFAGSGTLTLKLAAARFRVRAVEGDAASADALRRAAGGRVDVMTRDLARQPFSTAELAGLDALVLDPPYAGAAQQMAAIAASKLRRVIYVSCNPMALARDAAVLRAAGFGLAALTVIDPFLWSPEVEAVAAFTR